ncbi:glycosyltransferase family 88 protein [Legionella oakridgensis]|nr:glycosyltransferase family 88 protein [Legionella oakridgensis]
MNHENWVKIWFSTNPQQFINPIIAEQLLTLGKDNSKKKFTLLFSSSILNEEGKKQLRKMQTFYHDLHQEDFCHIEFLDIDSDDFISKLDESEQELFGYARLELANLGHGGNPAAASDIIRLLSPCYKQGNYTDFDVPLSFADGLFSENGYEEIPAAVLIPMVRHDGRYCNDVIIIASEAKATELNFITALQAAIVKMYRGEGLENILNNMRIKGTVDDEKQFVEMIESTKGPLTASSPLIALRAKIMNKITDGNSLDFWKEAYMQSVMQASGPGMYKRVMYNQQFPPTSVASYLQVKQLKTMIQSQIYGQQNAASWVPQRPMQGP